MEVKEIMNSPVEEISLEATVLQAAKMMKKYDVGVLPVEQDEKIVGIITDRDITIRVVAEELDPRKTAVSRMMTTDVVCCWEDTSMDEAARTMEESKVHRLVVLSRTNKICGILSLADIARKIKDDHLVHEILECICEPAHIDNFG